MMLKRRPAAAIGVAAALAVSAILSAQKKDDKKQDEAQKKEVQNLVKLADGLAAGQPAQNDLSLTWVREDVLKAQGNKEYVPFIVTIDPSKVTGGSVAFYWRVVAKNGQPTATTGTDAKKDEKKKDNKDKDKEGKKSEYAYEDVAFVPVTTTQGGPMRIPRSFTVPAGSYDVVMVAKEPASSQKNAPPPKTSIVTHTVDVPDFWNGELNTSTVIVAQRIDPLPAPLTPQQQADRPYALGQMEIVPQLDMTFTKKQELSTFLLIYNPKTDSANKPDVSVEYNFHSKAGNDWKFFNKTNPQNLNAQTLPPQFDLAAGHQLQSGQAVPLASFPEGDYKLEIKITDKIANKSLTRDVFFTVTAS
jgi:hypothetical protein